MAGMLRIYEPLTASQDDFFVDSMNASYPCCREAKRNFEPGRHESSCLSVDDGDETTATSTRVIGPRHKIWPLVESCEALVKMDLCLGLSFNVWHSVAQHELLLIRRLIGLLGGTWDAQTAPRTIKPNRARMVEWGSDAELKDTVACSARSTNQSTIVGRPNCNPTGALGLRTTYLRYAVIIGSTCEKHATPCRKVIGTGNATRDCRKGERGSQE